MYVLLQIQDTALQVHLVSSYIIISLGCTGLELYFVDELVLKMHRFENIGYLSYFMYIVFLGMWFTCHTECFTLKSCVHVTNSRMPEPSAQDRALYGHVYYALETAGPYWCARRYGIH